MQFMLAALPGIRRQIFLSEVAAGPAVGRAVALGNKWTPCGTFMAKPSSSVPNLDFH